MSVRSDDIRQEANDIVKSKKKLEACIETLSSGTRRERQKAASVIAVISGMKPESLVPYITELVDSLDRSEAQTRWEALEALTNLVDYEARSLEKAIPGAETALFDEDSGPLRLSAMRFMCKLGSTTENRSDKVWPLIDEGIQCYHGDNEFQDMLIAVIDFSNGKLSENVKKELKARMQFDADTAKGALKKRATQIVENLS